MQPAGAARKGESKRCDTRMRRRPSPSGSIGPVPSTELREGDRAGPFELPLSADLVHQFAAATRDPSQQFRDGRLVPPSLLATQVYRAQFAAMNELVPVDVFSQARSGVHGQHDLLLHRPITSDEKLHNFVETHSVRPAGDNLRITLHHAILDDGEALVAEQWWTTVLLGTTATSTGPDLPDYVFVREQDARVVAVDVVSVDDAMVRGYAEVSGDHSAHHFSVEAARRSGFETPFLHGLCTMALCARAATTTVAAGDPSRVRRVAVRFAAPAFLGQDLRIEIFDRRGGGFALEATCGDRPVIKNGLVELWP